MSRPLRIEFEGAWYHVMNRGLARQVVFETDDHRYYFLSLLEKTSKRFNAEWHAYCLMDNHYHLLIRTPEGNLQSIMRYINGLYTQYFNRSMNRDGPLFRGRYRSILVDADGYWTQLSRYIHRNPLEAGMIKKLGDYKWSSYRAYLRLCKCPDWLKTKYTLRAIAKRNMVDRYKAYVEEGNKEELITFFEQGKQSTLGLEPYQKKIELPDEHPDIPELKRLRQFPTVDEIIDSVCRHLEVDNDRVFTSKRGRGSTSIARPLVMYLCQEIGGMTLAEIANYFGLKNYTSSGSVIRAFRARVDDSTQLAIIIKPIILDLTL